MRLLPASARERTSSNVLIDEQERIVAQITATLVPLRDEAAEELQLAPLSHRPHGKGGIECAHTDIKTGGRWRRRYSRRLLLGGAAAARISAAAAAAGCSGSRTHFGEAEVERLAVEREQEMPRCPGSIHSRQRRVARTLLDALSEVRDKPNAEALLLGVEEAPQPLKCGVWQV